MARPAGKTATEVFGARVRDVRKRKAMSQQDLADRLEELGAPKHFTVIAKIETGARGSVTLDEVLTIAAALGVAPVHLFVPLADNVPMKVGKLRSSSGAFRAWVRGLDLLPGLEHESRTFRTEVPEVEWQRLDTAEGWRSFADATGGAIHFVPKED